MLNNLWGLQLLEHLVCKWALQLNLSLKLFSGCRAAAVVPECVLVERVLPLKMLVLETFAGYWY